MAATCLNISVNRLENNLITSCQSRQRPEGNQHVRTKRGNSVHLLCSVFRLLFSAFFCPLHDACMTPQDFG